MSPEERAREIYASLWTNNYFADTATWQREEDISAIASALAQARAEAFEEAADRLIRHAEQYRKQDMAGTAMVLEDAASAIREKAK